MEEIASNSTKYTEFIRSSPEHTFYMVELVFDRYVAIDMGDPSSESYQEYSALALAQASQYAIMDVFNQYTFAEVTSNMIAEIGYTEQITLISTMCTAWAVLLDSWTTKGAQEAAKEIGKTGAKTAFKAFSEKMGTMIASKFAKDYAIKLVAEILVAFVVHPLKEVVEEIVLDGLIESCVEGYVREMGGSDNLGFWLSTLATSLREKLSLDTITSTINSISNIGTRVSSKINAWIPDLRLDADSFRLDSGNMESERSDNVRTTYKTMEAVEERISEIMSLRKDKNNELSMDQIERLDKELEELIEVRTEMKESKSKGGTLWSILKSAVKLLGGITFTIGSMFFGGIGLYRLSKLIGSVGENIKAYVVLKSVDKTVDKLEQQNRMELDAINLYRAMPDEQQREFLKDAPANEKIAMLTAVLGKIDVDGIDKENNLLESKATISYMPNSKTQSQVTSQQQLANLMDQIRADRAHREKLDNHYSSYVKQTQEYKKLKEIKRKIDDAYYNSEHLSAQQQDEHIQAILMIGRETLLDMGLVSDSRVFNMHGSYKIDPKAIVLGFPNDQFKKLEDLTLEDYDRLDTAERRERFKDKYGESIAVYTGETKGLTGKTIKILSSEYKAYIDAQISTQLIRGRHGYMSINKMNDYIYDSKNKACIALIKDLKRELFLKESANLGLIIVKGQKGVYIPKRTTDIEGYCQARGIYDIEGSTFLIYNSHEYFSPNTIFTGTYGKPAFIMTETWKQKVLENKDLPRGQKIFSDENPASPFYGEFAAMRDDLIHLFNELEIGIKDGGNYRQVEDYDDVYFILGTSNDQYNSYLKYLVNGLTKRNSFFFGLSQEVIDTYLANIIIEIYEQTSMENDAIAQEKIKKVKEYFSPIYTLLGYSHTQNYREARLYRFIVSEYLKSNGIITSIYKFAPKSQNIYTDEYSNPRNYVNSYRAKELWALMEAELKKLENDGTITEDKSNEVLDFLKRVKKNENWEEKLFTSLKIRRELENKHRDEPFKLHVIDRLLEENAFFKNEFNSFNEDGKDGTSIGRLSEYLFGNYFYLKRNFNDDVEGQYTVKLLFAILESMRWTVQGPKEGLKWISEPSKKELEEAQLFFQSVILDYIRDYGKMNREPVLTEKHNKDSDIRAQMNEEYLEDKLRVFATVYMAYTVRNPTTTREFNRPAIEDVNNLFKRFHVFLSQKTSSSSESLQHAIDTITEWKGELEGKDPEFDLKNAIYKAAIACLNVFLMKYPHRKHASSSGVFNTRENWQKVLKDNGFGGTEIENILREGKKEQKVIYRLGRDFILGELEEDFVRDVLRASGLNGLTSSQEGFAFKSDDIKQIKGDFIKLVTKYFLKYDGNDFAEGEFYGQINEDSKEIMKKLADYAQQRDLGLNDHASLEEYLGIGKVSTSLLEEAVATEIPMHLRFQLNYEGIGDQGFQQLLQDSIRYYAGHTDLFVVKNGILYICDFKPDVHFDEGSSVLGEHVSKVFPQLITYALIMQDALKSEPNIKGVRCIAFNSKGAVEFDPNVMFYQTFDFMTNLEPSKWHQSLLDLNGDIKGKYKEGYKSGTDPLDYGYEDIDPKDDLKKFFIDFSRIAKKDFLKEQYGQDYDLYMRAFNEKIQEFQLEIGQYYIGQM
ncbi:MAG: hypothetical protein BAJALOKI1v1_1190011 [Promethearchaeota archaeon]|nr:MAG: hypothetical protein BAJALOKI1v1_1190011 [Candidatus Lokiarchaeota archaeon]